MTVRRRELLKFGAYGLLADIGSIAAAGSDRSPSRFSVASFAESPQDVIATLVEGMRRSGIQRDPLFGLYYSGYGPSLFSWDTFFDSLLLVHVGDTSLGKNAIRIHLSTQRKDGFIPRHWQRDTPAGRGDVWHRYESEEHAQPFLFQIAANMLKYAV